VAITSPVVSAIQTVQAMTQAAGQYQRPRMKRLPQPTLALATKRRGSMQSRQAKAPRWMANPTNCQCSTTRAKSLGYRDANAADKVGGVNLSFSIGSSSSSSSNTSSSDSARGSNVAAGQDVAITATGAGASSDVTIQGSTVKAGNNLLLSAEDELKLLAARTQPINTVPTKQVRAA